MILVVLYTHFIDIFILYLVLYFVFFFFFFKQKTAYEMRISDWSSDVCSSDLSLYANGDGYTLFTYTGTGAVSAQAAPTLTSPYVGFMLVHDAATKQVRLEVKRSSYTSGANNPNAQAAAAGLDSALASAIPRVRTDRSEEHTSELQSLMRISYAVFC